MYILDIFRDGGSFKFQTKDKLFTSWFPDYTICSDDSKDMLTDINELNELLSVFDEYISDFDHECPFANVSLVVKARNWLKSQIEPKDEVKDKRVEYDFDQQWGEGKTFDITVDGSNGVGDSMLKWLNKPELLSDEDKIELVDGLQVQTLGFQVATETRENFQTIAEQLLPQLESAYFNHDVDSFRKTMKALYSIAELNRIE